MFSLYQLAVYLYGLAIRLAAPFSPKARQWVRGRAAGVAALQQWRGEQDRAPIWLHCASLGEFEQGRPLIEAIKQQHPEKKILLSFFSPSGYELRKGYPLADYICYLPLDTRANARAFLTAAQPELAIFVKYEFWLNTLHELWQRRIPIILISATFRSEQIFFKSYGSIFRTALQRFEHIFLQDDASGALLAGIGVPQYTIAGDTRVDRVITIAQSAKTYPLVEQFVGQSPVLVIGSSWREDERLLLPFLNEALPAGWKVILAPHEISQDHLEELKRLLQLSHVFYSEAAAAALSQLRVLIIDNIGMLSALYQYGKIAYIGGGFGVSIHNTLEPIAFGLPVLFGPKYDKFREAKFLVANGGGFSVTSQTELAAAFAKLLDTDQYARVSQTALQYIAKNRGGTQIILDYLERTFWPPV